MTNVDFVSVSAPLIPTYGIHSTTPKNAHYGSRFKSYVDPTTYEDPNQVRTDLSLLGGYCSFRF